MGRALPLAMLAAVAALALPDQAAACGYHVAASPKGKRLGGHRTALAVGDSTLVFATPRLARRGIAADAKECRQWSDGVRMLRGRRRRGSLPHLSIMALGANGPISLGMVEQALAAVGRGRVLGLLTPKNLRSTQSAMRAAAARYPARVLLLDWAVYSAGRRGWFAADNLHVNRTGAEALAAFVADRAAGLIAAPARALDVPRPSSRGIKPCGKVMRGGRSLRVEVLHGRKKVICARARALVRKQPLRGTGRWQWWDWRPARRGPWTDVYRHAAHRGWIIGARPCPCAAAR